MAEMTWQAGDLSITLQTQPSHDGYQEVALAATSRGFSATRSSWLDAGDIDRFATHVHRMWQELDGDAELYGEHGIEFSLRLTMTTGGHVDIRVDINEPWAQQHIEAQTDQTFLPTLHAGLHSVL